MNVATTHLITNLPYLRDITCELSNLQGIKKYQRVRNCGWYGPPNSATNFSEGLCSVKGNDAGQGGLYRLGHRSPITEGRILRYFSFVKQS
jgi:hypothetical protein